MFNLISEYLYYLDSLPKQTIRFCFTVIQIFFYIVQDVLNRDQDKG
jgi:hypothetical protein